MLKNLLSAARDVYNEFNLSFQLKININMPDCCGRLPLIEAIARCEALTRHCPTLSSAPEAFRFLALAMHV